MERENKMREDLRELLDVIRGEGRFYVWGSGLHTYPEGDENKKKIFAACLELEQEGLIHRAREEPDHVLWVPGGITKE